jgi:putative transposase
VERLFRTESILLKSYWGMVVMDVYTCRIMGFGVGAANLDGVRVCRMFNRAIARQALPRHLSSDNEPVFRFHRWRANLRVLEVHEIKTVPSTPRSHTFIERLIGTIRRELLDRTFFWGQGDLERKLEAYQAYYNEYRCHTGLAGLTPAQRSGAPSAPTASLASYRWRPHCSGRLQTQEAA